MIARALLVLGLQVALPVAGMVEAITTTTSVRPGACSLTNVPDNVMIPEGCNDFPPTACLLTCKPGFSGVPSSMMCYDADAGYIGVPPNCLQEEESNNATFFAEICMQATDCTNEGDACTSLATDEEVEFCPSVDGCVCTMRGGETFSATICMQPMDCVEGDRCVSLETDMPVDSCPTLDGCVCASPSEEEGYDAETCSYGIACSHEGDICVSVDAPFQGCKPDGQCVCVENKQVELQKCTTAGDCSDYGDVCYSTMYEDAVDMCGSDDLCICASRGGGGSGDFERCGSDYDCQGGSRCVNMHYMMAEERCSGDCECIPCFFPEWMTGGCQRFETTSSSCRGALLLNVSEVCGDSCKVVLPAWVGWHAPTCGEYCGREGLTCRSAHVAWDEDESGSACHDMVEPRSCDSPIEGKGFICECEGLNMERRYRDGPDHELVDRCWSALDQYETCIHGKPELHDQMPDQKIREALQRERNQRCVDIPQDVFDRYNLVGCRGRR